MCSKSRQHRHGRPRRWSSIRAELRQTYYVQVGGGAAPATPTAMSANTTMRSSIPIPPNSQQDGSLIITELTSDGRDPKLLQHTLGRRRDHKDHATGFQIFRRRRTRRQEGYGNRQAHSLLRSVLRLNLIIGNARASAKVVRLCISIDWVDERHCRATLLCTSQP